jgi:hypothetical protein
MNVLLKFDCQTCKYTEDIGVDVACGVVIQGTVTVICPRCGHIIIVKDIIAAVPVRFKLEHRKEDDA